jgi:hypothetical protein
MGEWHTVDWSTVVATVAGAAAALFGAVLAQSLGNRDAHRREKFTERRDSYVAYLVAVDDAFSTLRGLADPTELPANLESGTQKAFADAGVYRSRERLLLAGSTSVISPAEAVLRRLASFRDVVRSGVKRRTVEYHDAYHPYGQAMWELRRAIRDDLGSSRITPADLDKETWDSVESCEFCREHKAQAAIPAQPARA